MACNAGQLLPSLLACDLYSIPVMVVKALMVPTRPNDGRIRRNLRRSRYRLDARADALAAPHRPPAIRARGTSLWHRGDYDAAVSAFDKALKADPDDAEAYYGRGRAHSGAGQYDAAIADYTSAIRLDPRSFDYDNRAVAYEQTSRWTAALADYNETIRLEPRRASLYVRRAALYARAGDVQKAQRSRYSGWTRRYGAIH